MTVVAASRVMPSQKAGKTLVSQYFCAVRPITCFILGLRQFSHFLVAYFFFWVICNKAWRIMFVDSNKKLLPLAFDKILHSLSVRMG